MCLHHTGVHRSQKTVFDLLELELELWVLGGAWCECWDLNSGPLEEQQVHVSAVPSLQSLFLLFTVCIYYRAGEMAWHLRGLTTVVKDLDLVHRNHTLARTIHNSSSRGLNATSSDLHKHQVCTQCVSRDVGKTCTQVK